jgi:hypothetical protein
MKCVVFGTRRRTLSLGRTMNLLLAAFLAAQALDHTSTGLALQRGCVESNPLVPHNYKASIAVGITIGGGSAWALSRAHKEHPKLVKTALILGAGVRAAAGIHNITLLNSCHR